MIANAQAQTFYREVNEGIVAISAAWDVELLEILCECGNVHCSERMEIASADYERLRATPTHFALVAGHENTAVEHVLDRTAGYLVVENHGPAATFARRTDPRAAAR